MKRKPTSFLTWNSTPWVLFCCAALSGCGTFSDDYGRSIGRTGRESLNGFGALRKSFENAGFRTRDITRLSRRVGLTTTIVWTPQSPRAIDPETTKWFERWLASGKRTLIYVVPDSGSAADYWAEAVKSAPPEQRLEYRRRSARERNRQLMWRLNRYQPTSNGWFMIVPLEHRAPVSNWSRDWATPDISSLDFASEYEIQFRDKEAVDSHNENLAASSKQPSAGATGPSGDWVDDARAETTKATYQFQPLLMGEAPLDLVPAVKTGAPSKTATSTPTLRQRELVLAAQITSKNWPDSQIIVVNSGSLLTNFAFSRRPNRRFADKLIDSSVATGARESFAGFVTTSASSIPVSETKPGVPKATGMEMLTVWPISLITIHGVLFGLIVCLVLFPVFGRPKRVDRVAFSDFGDHLDAVAALMRRTGGERYARHRISEYMRRLRGEAYGPWVTESESPRPMPDPTTVDSRELTAPDPNHSPPVS